EEKMLFPYIKNLAAENRVRATKSKLDSVVYPIETIEHGHREAGASLARIRMLSDNYALPDDASSVYHILYQSLKAFEQNMHNYFHLESNILFPKFLRLGSVTVQLLS